MHDCSVGARETLMPSALDHWHPVLSLRALGRRPRRVTVCGQDIVLFRAASGRVGALQRECPHRRMPLERGRVDGESLVCVYHGWRFRPDGTVSSGSLAGSRRCATSFDVTTSHGFIWIKNQRSSAVMPRIDPDGHLPLCRVQMLFKAPLPLVTDNLAEMEHTGEAHLFFGYDTSRMPEVQVKTETAPDQVRVIAQGPQRRLPALVELGRRLTGAASDDVFVDDLVFRFSPVHVISDSYWMSRDLRQRRGDGLHSRVFLVPRTEHETELFGFFYLMRGSSRLSRLFRPLVKRLVLLELERDRRVVEWVAERESRIDNLELGRFDTALLEIRQRLARTYGFAAHGAPNPQVPLTGRATAASSARRFP